MSLNKPLNWISVYNDFTHHEDLQARFRAPVDIEATRVAMPGKSKMTPEEKRERAKARRFISNFNKRNRGSGDRQILALHKSGMPIVDIVIRLNIPASQVLRALEMNP